MKSVFSSQPVFSSKQTSFEERTASEELTDLRSKAAKLILHTHKKEPLHLAGRTHTYTRSTAVSLLLYAGVLCQHKGRSLAVALFLR